MPQLAGGARGVIAERLFEAAARRRRILGWHDPTGGVLTHQPADGSAFAHHHRAARREGIEKASARRQLRLEVG